MRVTPELRKAINEAVRRIVAGAAPLAEVGLREDIHDNWSSNALNWQPESDLCDLRALRDLKEIDDCPDLPGAATLDLYVRTGLKDMRELETNVYITIKDGKLADAHKDTLRADARTFAILGRKFSQVE